MEVDPHSNVIWNYGPQVNELGNRDQHSSCDGGWWSIWEGTAMNTLAETCVPVAEAMVHPWIGVSMDRPHIGLWLLWEVNIGQCDSWQEEKIYKAGTQGPRKAVDKKPVAFSLDSGLSDCVLIPNTLCGSKWYPHWLKNLEEIATLRGFITFRK